LKVEDWKAYTFPDELASYFPRRINWGRLRLRIVGIYAGISLNKVSIDKSGGEEPICTISLTQN